MSESFAVDYDENGRRWGVVPDPGDLEITLRALQRGLFVQHVFARGKRVVEL